MTTVNDPKGEAGSKKAPMWLLPPVALEQTAWVHKLGSDKYGRLVPVLASSCGEELVEFCSCEHTIEKLPATLTAHTLREACVSSATNSSTQRPAARPATQAESSGREGFANPATTPNFSGKTPDMPSGSEKTTLTGSPTTTTGIWSAAGDEASAPKFEPGIAATAGQRPCPPTACRSTTSVASLRNRAAAESAAGHPADGDSTSTTTTQPSSSEGFCATGATKALASSETIEKLLRRHSPTCSARSLQIREGHVWQRGDFNWRRTGVCATTYVSAIMRHLNAWRDGEDLDPESGISHIAHIATSCNILMDAAACGTLQDDRNKRSPGGRVTPHEVRTAYDSDDWPPVPRGYDRWESRGLAWKPDRSAVFACRVPSATWSKWIVSCGPEQPSGCAVFEYIEAVKDDKAGTTAGNVRQPAIAKGTPVSVNPMFEPAFRSVVEKVVETRDGLLYTFANGLTYSDNEIFSITPISSTPASDTDEQP